MAACKHDTVYADLRSKILDGTYAPRDSLGGERALCSRYGVSRATLRTAIAQLKRDGLVHSRQGSGVYVNPPELHDGAGLLCEAGADGACPVRQTRVLQLEVIPAGRRGAPFGLGARDRLVHYLLLDQRDGEPHALEEAYLPHPLVASVELRKLPRLSRLGLEEACGHTISHVHQRVRACAATEVLARALVVPVATPLLQMDEYLYLPHGALLRHVRVTMREGELGLTKAR